MQDKFNELKNASKPLQEYLSHNYDPHTIIIVQNDRVDVYRGEICASTPENLRD